MIKFVLRLEVYKYHRDLDLLSEFDSFESIFFRIIIYSF